VEWPAKRCYVGLVAVGVQEQAEDIIIPPLLRNCLTLNDISLPSHCIPLQNSGPCNSFYCLGHSNDDDDDDDDDVDVRRRRRRKKRCIRFLDTPDDCGGGGGGSPLRASTAAAAAASAALADSTSDAHHHQPNDVTMTSPRDPRRGGGFPAPDAKRVGAAGSSSPLPQLHRKLSSAAAANCDSSPAAAAAQNGNGGGSSQLHWTSRAPGISHVTSPVSAAAASAR